MSYDAVIVGTGPAGIAAAGALKDAGLSSVMLDKGVLADAITKWPYYMRFFSTAEKVELPGFPLITAEEKPTREEYLHYLRRYVRDRHLEVRTGHTVEQVTRVPGGGFTVTGHDEWKAPFALQARYVIVATGAYEFPKLLKVRGEELPKVSHYFTEVHPYAFRKVAVVGGRNSAAEAALLLFRAGAEVNLIHRGPGMRPLKFWLQPDLENRIQSGEIRAYFNSVITEIRPREIDIRTGDGSVVTVPNDYVLAMTGYHPDMTLLEEAGVKIDPATNRPQYDPESLETNVSDLYVAGVIAAGDISNEIFIENSREHGEMIVKSIQRKAHTRV